MARPWPGLAGALYAVHDPSRWMSAPSVVQASWLAPIRWPRLARCCVAVVGPGPRPLRLGGLGAGALAGVSDAGRCPAALGRPVGVSDSRLSGGLVAAHGRWWSQTGPARPGIAGADPSHLVVAGPGPAPGPQVPKPPRCSPGAANRTCVLSRSDRAWRRCVAAQGSRTPFASPNGEQRGGLGWTRPHLLARRVGCPRSRGLCWRRPRGACRGGGEAESRP